MRQVAALHVLRLSAIGCLFVVSATGCEFKKLQHDSKLAPVTGRVTLNGEPLPGVKVYFMPTYTAPSTALTDDDGRYSLMYDAIQPGAAIGIHRVQITRNLKPVIEPKPELPARYNEKSDLKVTVERGDNVFNFDLTETADDEPGTEHPYPKDKRP